MLLVAAIVFAESGLLIGFFLPGDSLLFVAGIAASSAAAEAVGVHLNIFVLLPMVFVAAVAGDQVGYWFGNKSGPVLFRREDSKLFHKDHLVRAEHFFERHGPKTIILARFVPVVRTFAPIVAGAGKMRYRTFVTYNVVGGFLWGAGVTMVGYTVGQVLGEVVEIDKFLLPLIALIVVLSFIPAVVEFIRHRREDKTEESETEAEAEEIADELEERLESHRDLTGESI
ncbi:MAG: DedA family protein [Actinobacteria bacterium ATB1]|nr:DedA family protein [Actinobacteria bacterium ATB1]